MTTIPLAPVVGIIVFSSLVTTLRMIFLRDSVTDRLINRALALANIGMTFGLCFADPGIPAVVLHVGSVITFLMVSSLYGAARLLGGADPSDAKRRQHRYDGVALVVPGVTVVGDLAHVVGLIPASLPAAWYTTGSALAVLPVAVSGFRLMRAGLGEVRAAQASFAPKLAFAVLVAVAVFWICYATSLLAHALGGGSPAEPGLFWAMTGYTFFGVITALFSIPLVHLALGRAGWDRDSRDCRTLEPLWADLTAAVPHIALVPDETDTRSPALRRYRMAIEIRDALLQLRRHAEDYPPQDPRGRLLHAVRAAEAGLGPDPALGRDSELRHLLGLAARWPRARRDHAAAADDDLSAARASR